MKWIEPWSSTVTQDEQFHYKFIRELESEVSAGHPLHGIKTCLIARGAGDDTLYKLLDGSEHYAVVHLTWSRHPEPLPWPETAIYNSFKSFVNERMIPDNIQTET